MIARSMLLSLILLALSGCAPAGAIFKAGLSVGLIGVFVLVALIALVIHLVR
jgi:hypothetical protein